MEDDIQWKMTSNGIYPQNIKSGISQPPLIGLTQTLDLSLNDRGRQPQVQRIEYNI
jgi:hypothetical protein